MTLGYDEQGALIVWYPFKKKPLLKAEDERFLIETYRWLLTHFGGDQFYQEAQLILPTDEFFPAQVNSSMECAEQTFEQVKLHAGMQQWPCVLEVQAFDPDPVVGDALIIQHRDVSPLGTFSVNEHNEAVITWNPKLASDPTQMVATFAHELAHYLTLTAPEPPPGGWDNWEFATDIAASFMGFGLFMANAVFKFRQYSETGFYGWESSHNGYLSEPELSYALAIFLRLKDIPWPVAAPHCDKNIRVYLHQALKELDEKPHIEELRRVRHLAPE